jgi:phosphoribosylamine--glycine ligase
MLRDEGFGEAGAEILVEEYMEGEELSCFFVTDGTELVGLPYCQDHKRLLDGDRGPNTGGMGAYCPVSLADGSHSAALGADVADRIVRPTLAAMRDRGMPFTGLLYAGLMVTRDGPKVVEFNCRFGDPETQAVLPYLRALPLYDLLHRVAAGDRLGPGDAIRGDGSGAAVTTVVAAAGYPDAPRTGDPIALPEPPADVFVFHAGTATDGEGRLVTSGGRVLAVTALGDTFERAQSLSRATAERVAFAGKQHRSDIGWREAARRAGAPRD